MSLPATILTKISIATSQIIVFFVGHEEGASCVDLSSDGKTLWTGGLDNAVCTWDIAEQKRLQKYELDSQVCNNSY
jgi:groucho